MWTARDQERRDGAGKGNGPLLKEKRVQQLGRSKEVIVGLHGNDSILRRAGILGILACGTSLAVFVHILLESISAALLLSMSDEDWVLRCWCGVVFVSVCVCCCAGWSAVDGDAGPCLKLWACPVEPLLGPGSNPFGSLPLLPWTLALLRSSVLWWRAGLASSFHCSRHCLSLACVSFCLKSGPCTVNTLSIDQVR